MWLLQASVDYAWHETLDHTSADQWAVLHFESPVPCALPAVGIGSHLDASSSSSTCRLAFYGLMLQAVTLEELRVLRIFKAKNKEGQVDRVQDANSENSQ